MRVCPKCSEAKEESEFLTNSAKRRPPSTCRQCHNEDQRLRRAKKPKKIKVGKNYFLLHTIRLENGNWLAWSLDVSVFGRVRDEAIAPSKAGATKSLQNLIKRIHQKETDPERFCEHCQTLLRWNVDEHFDGESYWNYRRRKFCSLLCSGKHGGMQKQADTAAQETKTCPKCGLEKLVGDFPTAKVRKNGSRKYGYCRECHKQVQWESRLNKLFSLSEEEYQAILDHQGGACFVCRSFPKTHKLAVDHDHKTGQIRGLLCHLCNKALGLIGDNKERLVRIALYLTEPPAVAALNKIVFGRKGRVDNKEKKA